MEKSMVTKLILDATSYKQGIDLAKQATVSINKELELWKAQNKAVEGSAKTLAKQLDVQKAQQQVLSAEMTQTIKKYNDVVSVQGEDSKAAMNLKNKILDLQTQQAKLNNEIEKSSKPFTNFKNHMSDLSNNLKNAGDKMISAGTSMTTHITAPAIAAAAGILKLADNAVKYADELGVMSEKTGIGLKSLQEMQFVTNQLDMDFGVIQSSMAMFTNRLKGVEAGTGDTSKGMKALGISMEDSAGKTRPVGDIYNDVIKKLSSMKNESDRNIMASAMFGRSWQELAPLLNAGGAEIERLRKQANDLGLVMSNESIDAARQFGDEMDALKMQFKVSGAEIGTAFMPLIKDTLIPFIQSKVIPSLKDFAGHVSSLINWFKGLNPTMQTIIGVAVGLVVAIGPIAVVVGNVIKGFSMLITVIKGAIGVIGALASPVTLIVIGVAALAAGAYLLIKNWDKAVPFFQSMWTIIKSAFSTGIAGINVALSTMIVGLTKALEFVVGGIAGFLSGLTGMLSKIPYIGDAFKGVQEGIDSFRGSLKNMANDAETNLAKAKAGMTANANDTKEAWKTMTTAASELGKGMGNTIQESVNKVKGMFGGLTNTSKSTAKDVKATSPDYASAGQALGDALADGIKLGADKSAAEIEKSAKAIQKNYTSAIDALESQITRLLVPTKDLKQQLNNQQLAIKLTQQEIDKLNEEYGKMVKAHVETSTAAQNLKNKIEDEKTSLIELGNKAADTSQKIKDAIIKNIDSMNNAIKTALQRRYETEKKLQERSIEDQLTNLERWENDQLDAIQKVHDATTIALDADTKKQVDALQAQIDAIDDIQTASERAQSEKERDDKVSSLREKLAAEMDADKKIAIEEELNDAITDAEQQRLKDSQDAQKDAFRKQIETIKNAAEDKKNQLDIDYQNQQNAYNADYEAQKRNLDDKKTALDRFYQDKLDSASIEAEAEKLIMDKNQKDLIELLTKYGDQYEDAGKTLGESFYDGFKSWADQIAELIANVISGSSSAVSKANEAIIKAKEDYAAAEAIGDTAGMAAAHSAAETAREAGGTISSETTLQQALANKAIIKAKEDYDAAKAIGDKAGMESAKKSADAARVAGGTITAETTLQQARGYAKGTDSAAPGWAWTGEKGPELIKFKGGEQVIPNDKLGGTAVINIYPQLNSKYDTESMMEDVISTLKRKGVRLSTPY
jgi:DNA repair exonuclease SbcCD ATPase subunit